MSVRSVDSEAYSTVPEYRESESPRAVYLYER
jgi:hypothetical protein